MVTYQGRTEWSVSSNNRWAARRQVNFDSVLQTHAEVAVALAGFASVAAVLQRPLSSDERRSFLALLFTALIQVVGSLVPIWLSTLGLGGPTLWRIATALVLALSITLLLVLVYVSLRYSDGSRAILINAPVTYICHALTLVTLGALLLNTLGIPVAPGFGLYYTALLLGMIVIFVMFADTVVREFGESS